MLLIWPWQVDAFELRSPESLIFLLLVPALAAVYILMQFRRRRYALRFASVSLLREAVGKGPGFRRHIPAFLYLLALAAMVVALARPQGIVPISEDRGIVVLAIDVSGSMLAEDVAPNRMEATKRAAREFVSKQPKGVHIGVVSFSDFGAVNLAPTKDKKAAEKTIERLTPQRGTNIGGGLQASLDAIYDTLDAIRPGASPSPAPAGAAPTPGQTRDTPPPASIVLVSDGQSNTGPPPLRAADEAVAAGVKVYTIGIGTPEGTVLRIQGRAVFTRLDEATLRDVADITGGRYLNAQDESGLKRVYEELSRERQSEPQETELTFYLTGTALLLSVVGGAFSLFWFNRLP